MISTHQQKLQQLFSNISELIISPYKVDIVIKKIMQEVEKYFNPSNWSILRYDPAADELFFAYAKGLDQEAIKSIRLKKGEGIAGSVIETGKSLFIRDCQNDPRFSTKVDNAFAQKTKSIIAAPIKFKQVVLGVLELVNLENESFFNDEDLFVLEIIANFSAIALINATLFENLITISHHDPLTGAYNRAKLDELKKSWCLNSGKKKEQRNKSISVFLLDLNNFKEINDNLGHHEGDNVLKELARKIKEESRRRDLFFRIGGDEFLYLAIHDKNDSIKDAEQEILAKLRKISRSLEPTVGRFSIGMQTGPMHDLNKLIKQADKNMYIDKEKRKANPQPALS